VSASLRPKIKPRDPSPGQTAVRLAFRKAVSYANTALANPATRGIYERAKLAHHKPLFSLAVGDYFKPPVVDEIDLASYAGQVGDKIHIMAHDDIEVFSVQVIIRSSAGAILEQGAAVNAFNKWEYTGTTALLAGANVTIEVTAKDHANNLGTKQAPYHKP
jgi:hypothetical protein